MKTICPLRRSRSRNRILEFIEDEGEDENDPEL